MMKKEQYQRTELNISEFSNDDVIVTSGQELDPYEDNILKPKG